MAGGRTGPNGTGAELVEITTGLESSGLGCGQKVQPVAGGAPKVPQCWLVVVPRGDAGDGERGHALRRRAAGSAPRRCRRPRGRTASPSRSSSTRSTAPARSRTSSGCIAGNELPRRRRVQLAAGALRHPRPASVHVRHRSVMPAPASSCSAASPERPGWWPSPDPIDPATRRSRQPRRVRAAQPVGHGHRVQHRADAEARGAARKRSSSAGVRVAELNLTPRLVAKLLTQSYRQQTAIKSAAALRRGSTGNPSHLGLDPDFLRFNPEFELLDNGGKNLGGLVMPSRGLRCRPAGVGVGAGRPRGQGVARRGARRLGDAGEPRLRHHRRGQQHRGRLRRTRRPTSTRRAIRTATRARRRVPGGTVVPPPLCGTDWLPYTQSLRDAARLTRGRRRRRPHHARTPSPCRPTGSTGRTGPRPSGPAPSSRSPTLPRPASTACRWPASAGPATTARTRTFIAPDAAGLTAGVDGDGARRREHGARARPDGGRAPAPTR